MFFMYVDESGDVGMGPEGSRYFCLSALVIHECNWTESMIKFNKMRVALSRKYGFDSNEELHASSILGRKKSYRNGLNRQQAIFMLRDVLRYEARFKQMRSINIVVDKYEKSYGYDPFKIAWETLINRFENTIRHNNFPSPWKDVKDERGFLIVDKTDEEKLRKLVRSMRYNNSVPSMYSGDRYTSNLIKVVEDPMHKDSSLSLPIQLCDVNAYFLKQTVDPNTTIKKHKAKNYFYYLKPILLTQACTANEYGIVYR